MIVTLAQVIISLFFFLAPPAAVIVGSVYGYFKVLEIRENLAKNARRKR